MPPQDLTDHTDETGSVKPERPQLAVREWIAVVVIIGCFTTLTCISYFNDASLPETTSGMPHYLKPQQIEVLVQGAVAAPGSYKLDVNAKLKDVLTMAVPKQEADLRRIKPEGKLRNGQVVTIPARELIVVNLVGAVENPGKIQVPKGTKLNEIGNYTQLSSDADYDKINRKRILKNEEVINVPSKAL